MNTDAVLRAIVDRQAITDVLYRYGSTIDQKDYGRLRTLFANDARAKYGERDWMVGGDTIVDWIRTHSEDRSWQHHLLSVYHVDIDGDTASTLTYHTSHQTGPERNDVVHVIVARYRDVLQRTGDQWLITEKIMEIGWRENRGAVST